MILTPIGQICVGNLNPYATYAAGGIEEEVSQPAASNAPTTLQPVSRSLTTARPVDAPINSGNTAGGATRMYKTFNKGRFTDSICQIVK